MSTAYWCDPGEHAFSALEEGFQQMTLEEAVNDKFGNQGVKKVQIHVCSVHKLTVNREPSRRAVETVKEEGM